MKVNKVCPSIINLEKLAGSKTFSPIRFNFRLYFIALALKNLRCLSVLVLVSKYALDVFIHGFPIQITVFVPAINLHSANKPPGPGKSFAADGIRATDMSGRLPVWRLDRTLSVSYTMIFHSGLSASGTAYHRRRPDRRYL